MKKAEPKTTELVCENGLRPCEAPLTVAEYYPYIGDNGNMPEIAVVEILDKPVAANSNRQYTKELKIRAKFTFARLAQASIDLDYEKIGETKVKKTQKAKPSRS